MRVFFIGVFLVLLAISPGVVQSFAEPIISVEFDKLSYNTGESLTIFGNVSELSMPVIVMRIFDPDENIIFAGSVNIHTTGNFTKTIQLDPPFYEKIGDYKVQFDYRKISHQEFFSISKDNFGSEEIFEEEKHSIKPEITLLFTDKIGYIDNDRITISGMVLVKLPVVLMLRLPAKIIFSSGSNIRITITGIESSETLPKIVKDSPVLYESLSNSTEMIGSAKL